MGAAEVGLRILYRTQGIADENRTRVDESGWEQLPLAGSNGRLRVWWPWRPELAESQATAYHVGLGQGDIELAIWQPYPYPPRADEGPDSG